MIEALAGSAVWAVPARCGPHAETADAAALTWVEATGLCETTEESLGLARIRPGLLASWCHPRADAADCALVARWMAWLFLLDDRIDESDLGRDADRLDHYLTDPLGVAVGGRTASSPVGRALAEIIDRASQGMSDSWQLRFRRHIADYLSACVWQAAHRQANQTPSPDTFPVRRREFGAIIPSFDLVERTESGCLPPSLYHSRPYQDVLIAAANLVCWTNDLMTVEKEAAQGDPHNLVLVTAHHRGLDRNTAARIVAEACEDSLLTHERARHDLASLTRTRDAPPRLRQHADHCADALIEWARGHLEWGLRTPRYDNPSVPSPAEAS
ncbi:terpene synthase family protein [Kitasatospora sp. NPDC086801]|uniref:(-)-delta-cadinene synthase n=1 Tax=Kitasatospora sp. NPDC086801 TaxID=3364066 RepID=UPI003806262D